MNPGTHLSDLRLDQSIAGELDAPAQSALHSHLTACAPCARRHDALVADAAQARADPRLAALAPVVGALLADGPPLRRFGRVRVMVATFASCAVAAAIAVVILRPPGDDRGGASSPGWRTKGELAMEVFVRRPGRATPVEILVGDDPVHPGDQLRVRVRAPARGYFGVFAVDASARPAPSEVSGYLPPGGHLAAVEPRVPLLLDGAVELDTSLGREQLLGVFCPSPRDKQTVAGQLHAALAGAGGDPARFDKIRAVSDCAVTPLSLRKVAAP